MLDMAQNTGNTPLVLSEEHEQVVFHHQMGKMLASGNKKSRE